MEGSLRGERPRGSLAAACGLGAATFAFRYLCFDYFQNDHFTHLSRARQMMFGEWPVRDFVDPGMPLSIGLSALAQWLLGPGLHSELVFIAIALGLSAALLCLIAIRVSRSVLIGLCAAAVTVLVFPAAYNYPKYLPYAAAFIAMDRYAARPTGLALAGLSAAVAAAFLLRHDHGGLLAAGAGAGLIARHARPQDCLKVLIRYAVVILLLITPYLLWVQRYEGVVTHFREGVAYAAHASSSPLHVPHVALDASQQNAAAVMFYLVWLVVFACIGALVVFWRAIPEADRSVVTMALALQIVMNVMMLREPLQTYISYVLAPAAVLLAWVAGAVPGMIRTASVRPYVVGAATVMLMLFVVSAARVGAAGHELSSIAQQGLVKRARSIQRELAPPNNFAGRHSNDPVVAYLKSCMPVGSRLFTMAFAPQLSFYTEHAFAGGHPMLSPGLFSTRRHEAVMLERLKREDVPFVVADADTVKSLFIEFPGLAAHIADRYREAARFDDGRTPPGQVFIVSSEAGRPPLREYGERHLRCYVESSDH